MGKVFTITAGIENLGAIKTGGQGSVFKARKDDGKICAIKLIPKPMHSGSSQDSDYQRFQSEVSKLRKVNEVANHHVVTILGSGITESGNFPFIEMEFIDGPDLEELLKERFKPVFPLDEIVKVCRHLSDALAHCHQAGIRHGDIKSNNVKYDSATDSYILLDFGMAVMSDEERRTSLQRAGAVEFMAPEQAEGRLLYQTDVYSFGIVVYELLTGQVPFQLGNRGELAWNEVMQAHIQSLPPEPVGARRRQMTGDHGNAYGEEELNVPAWLLHLLYRCMEKDPEQRFSDGMALKRFIDAYSAEGAGAGDSASFLLQENIRLRRERDQLQQQINDEQKNAGLTGANVLAATDEQAATPMPVTGKLEPLVLSRKKIIWFIAIILVSCGVLYGILKIRDANKKTERVVGEYKIVVNKAYLYNEPSKSARSNEFLMPSPEVITAYNRKNDFLYTEVSRETGVLKGWLRRSDLMPRSEWEKKHSKDQMKPEVKARIEAQLQNAGMFLAAGKTGEALIIYNNLSSQEVPEAMFQYGRLALQNRNKNISCAEAFQLLKQAAARGYAPAKRTLGFLYVFADEPQTLKEANYYQRCQVQKNIEAGAVYLTEAMLQGDTTAAAILDQLNSRGQ